MDCINKDTSNSEAYNQYGAYLIKRFKYTEALEYISKGLESAKEKLRKHCFTIRQYATNISEISARHWICLKAM